MNKNLLVRVSQLEPQPSGFLNVFKPQGITSHDVVSYIKRSFNLKKVGHTGTLDPLACGVLVVCINSATKFSHIVMDKPKQYRVEATFGIATTTGDAQGKIKSSVGTSQCRTDCGLRTADCRLWSTEFTAETQSPQKNRSVGTSQCRTDCELRTADCGLPTANYRLPTANCPPQISAFSYPLSPTIPYPLIAVAQSLLGEQLQTPPMTSAVKVNGRKLYELFRENKEVERQPRKINVYRFELLKFDFPLFPCSAWEHISPTLSVVKDAGDSYTNVPTQSVGTRRKDKFPRALFDIECSKGTYVRTLIETLGEKLGCGAYVSFLVRTKVGPFSISKSHNLTDINCDNLSDIIQRHE